MHRPMILAAMLSLAGGIALAQDAGHGHAAADASPSTAAFMAVNARMHEGMMIDFTGDADVDFVRGMIPHHQGAIDMAKVVLEHDGDPEARRMAEKIIAAQEAEIAEMEAKSGSAAASVEQSMTFTGATSRCTGSVSVCV